MGCKMLDSLQRRAVRLIDNLLLTDRLSSLLHIRIVRMLSLFFGYFNGVISASSINPRCTYALFVGNERKIHTQVMWTSRERVVASTHFLCYRYLLFSLYVIRTSSRLAFTLTNLTTLHNRVVL